MNDNEDGAHVKPKPREKLNAKKEKLDSISTAESSSLQQQQKRESFHQENNDHLTLSIGKNAISISNSSKPDSASNRDETTSTTTTTTASRPAVLKEKSGLFLETIDRLVDARGEVLAKNETVKYLGKPSSSSLHKKSKNKREPREISVVSVPSSPQSKTKRENYAIKVPSLDKNLDELDNNDLEEIAYVVKHHEKKKNSTNNNYFYKDQPIYPNGPLKEFLDSFKDDNFDKFQVEELTHEEQKTKAEVPPVVKPIPKSTVPGKKFK